MYYKINNTNKNYKIMVNFNIAGLFKYVLFDRQNDAYSIYSHVGKCISGILNERVFISLLKLNMCHLGKLLKITDICLKHNELEEHVSQLLKDFKIILESQPKLVICDVDLKKLLLENDEKILENIVKLDCNESIETIENNCSKETLNRLQEMGKKLRKYYMAKDWATCLGIIMAINTHCLDTYMYIVTTLFNLFYLAFMEFNKSSSIPPLDIRKYLLNRHDNFDISNEYEYVAEKDEIIEYLLTTAIQQFLIDNKRNEIVLREILRKSTHLPGYIQDGENKCSDMEQILFKYIIKHRSVRSVYTSLNIKRAQSDPKYLSSPQRIYEKWSSASQEQKLNIYTECRLNEDSEKDLFPYILTLYNSAHRRTFEYMRFCINQLLQERDICFKNFIRNIFSDFEELYEHCLFPNREMSQMVCNDDNIVPNSNEFRDDDYNIRGIIHRIVSTDEETLNYIVKKFTTLLNKRHSNHTTHKRVVYQ